MTEEQRPRTSEDARPEDDGEQSLEEAAANRLTKPESEMSRGKNYDWELPENRHEFDPATTRMPQEGQGQGS